ncbi:hypothetical protein VTK73DRAFT_974 [Phialemonium thermophilum]|uniref:Bet v1-like protein n=1 Tax=Phialemonium thermophilum TaxID=223376 RepID=A0ABR3VU37_9PEZI
MDTESTPRGYSNHTSTYTNWIQNLHPGYYTYFGIQNPQTERPHFLPASIYDTQPTAGTIWIVSHHNQRTVPDEQTMSSTIPTSTSVVESAVIRAPLSHVWHYIKLQDFPQFWSALDKAEFVRGVSNDTDVVRWTFKDGSVLEVKQEEHSTINHYITYSVITAQPDLPYSSVLSTIRCYPVTSGELEGSTYVEWTGHFSSDADASVIQDAKFKRRDALADLAKVATKK